MSALTLPHTRRARGFGYGQTEEVIVPMPLPAVRAEVAFTVQPLGDGRAQLRDADGVSVGIFANPQLAAQTAGLFQ